MDGMMAEKDDILQEGREAFERCSEAENENRETALKDIRFARGGEQWPEAIAKARESDGRPMLTINKLPAFGRQVVNDARMNKPAVKVHPVDDDADPETANVLADLIRNIENVSNASVAYDTAIDSAVFGGVGYWRIGADYTYDDSFDMDLCIDRVRNPFSVYGDPNSTAADSSDWDVAFVVDRLGQEQFEREYGDKAKISWSDTDAWGGSDWRDGEEVMVAEWWSREKVDRKIVQVEDLRDGKTYTLSEEDVTNDPDLMVLLEQGIVQFRRERMGKAMKTRQRIMSGAEVLEDNEWPGKYIPIIPVYGDEFDIEGKVYRRSLIHDSKDAQRMFNYWRTTGTELVALAPRIPYIGRKGTFDSDQERWNTANTQSHAYLEYDGEMPVRQPLDSGPAAGALQEALNASDDIKSIIGLYDASMGARSNETSGKAIVARQREGDVSTFHFIDNLSRAIRHTGCVLIDLIPHFYSEERIIRVRGEDDTERPVHIGKRQVETDENGQPKTDDDGNMILAIHDLTMGKYDVTVSSGPSFTTRRQEAAAEMTEIIRAFPAIAPLVADLLAKNLDWPGADEMAERLKRMVPKEALGEDGDLPPQIKQFIQQGQAMIEALSKEVEKLKTDRTIDMMEARNKQAETVIKGYDAETKRMSAEDQRAGQMQPQPNPLQSAAQ